MLKLLVLKSRDLKSLKDFYSIFGLTFIEEKHEKGPLHYSAAADTGLIIEIYPTKEPVNLAIGIRLGFVIKDLSSTLAEVEKKGGKILNIFTEIKKGHCAAIVVAPDAVKIELYLE